MSSPVQWILCARPSTVCVTLESSIKLMLATCMCPALAGVVHLCNRMLAELQTFWCGGEMLRV